MADVRVLALLLAAGVVVPGVADFTLSRAGYPTAGAAAWVLGYGTTLAVLWFGWVRHLDFEG